MEEKPRVFLSYCREDVGHVRELQRLLRLAGFVPWMDKERLLGGEPWQKALDRAIRQADFFLAIVTRCWNEETRYVHKEIETALAEQRRRRDLRLIPVRFEDCGLPAAMTHLQWIDYFTHDGWRHLYQSMTAAVRDAGQQPPVFLRSDAITQVSPSDAVEVIKRLEIFDSSRNSDGKGIPSRFEVDMDNRVVSDVVTGRMWEMFGSNDLLRFKGPASAEEYIRGLNANQFSGYSDWRLPTLEEAMSLMRPQATQQGLHIPACFAPKQVAIYTCDTHTLPYGMGESVWIAYYTQGDCQEIPAEGRCFVRAVRTIW
jgi:hypothetical protein